MSTILIAGAGPAGLTAAYTLSKLGLKPTVLEANLNVGGLSKTVSYRDYRFDIGGHRFFSKAPLINELWDEILGDDLLFRKRLSRIFYEGRFFDYPLKAANAFTGLGPMEALWISLSYAKAHLFPHPEEANLAEWVSNRFGERLYRIFFKTYTEKVWGMPCTEISADWAAQRIKNLSLGEVFRHMFLGRKHGGDGQILTTLIDQFRYPRLGPGMMWERCRDLLAQRGHQTLPGIHVDRLVHRDGRIVCAHAKTNSGESVEVEAEHFISTMPLRELVGCLDPLPPAEVIDAADRLLYRDYVTVALIVARDQVFPDNWIYIHSPAVKIGRIQNYKNWSPQMVPDSRHTSLGLEYFLWEDDAEWSWPDAQWIERGIHECARIGLIDAREVTDGTVIRAPKAYPVYDRHYQSCVDLIRRYLEIFSNLQTIGRNGLHRYNNQDHSMLTGIYAARNIAGEGRYDVWSINTEKAYIETSGSTPGRLMPMRIDPSLSATSTD